VRRHRCCKVFGITSGTRQVQNTHTHFRCGSLTHLRCNNTHTSGTKGPAHGPSNRTGPLTAIGAARPGDSPPRYWHPGVTDPTSRPPQAPLQVRSPSARLGHLRRPRTDPDCDSDQGHGPSGRTSPASSLEVSRGLTCLGARRSPGLTQSTDFGRNSTPSCADLPRHSVHTSPPSRLTSSGLSSAARQRPLAPPLRPLPLSPDDELLELLLGQNRGLGSDLTGSQPAVQQGLVGTHPVRLPAL